MRQSLIFKGGRTLFQPPRSVLATTTRSYLRNAAAVANTTVARSFASNTIGPALTAVPEHIKIAGKNTRKMGLTRSDVTYLLLQQKNKSKLTFEQIASKFDGLTEVWVTAAIFGQHPFRKDEAEKLVDVLGVEQQIRAEVVDVLQTVPIRGSMDHSELLNDPTIYRLQEVVKVYGLPIKALIHEHFGDGIMSAIGFNMKFEKQKGPEGEDRVVITLNGKFLPYTRF